MCTHFPLAHTHMSLLRKIDLPSYCYRILIGILLKRRHILHFKLFINFKGKVLTHLFFSLENKQYLK